MSFIETIAVHHSTGDDMQPDVDIARYHVEHNGWSGIGYTMTIDGLGVIRLVGDPSTVRAHVGEAWNLYALGICIKGDFTTHHPKPIQIAAFKYAVKWLYDTWGINADIKPHFWYTNTACPGATSREWLAEVGWRGN